jgi:ATP-dependent DNA helicase RecG
MTEKNSENLLALSLSSITGIGAKSSESLAKAGVYTVFDLFLRVPKDIIDEEASPGFLHMEAGHSYVAEGKVLETRTVGSSKKRFEAVLEDDSGRLHVVFFGPAVFYAQSVFQKGKTLIVSGEAKVFMGKAQMVHPKIVKELPENFASKRTDYSQVQGITPPRFKKIVERALVQFKEPLLDHLSRDFCSKHKMAPLFDALLAIHKPSPKQAASWENRGSCPYFRRLAFEELLSYYARLFKKRSHGNDAMALPIALRSLTDLCENFLPFSLTGAQERVLKEIIAQLSHDKPMARLLQGDVGAGKTAVAAVLAKHVLSQDFQVAVMAPTEILAEQIFRNFQSYFKERQDKIALLSSQTKTKARALITRRLKEQDLSILVGTHALLSHDVDFRALNLLIIDEQHRFGVEQRSFLLNECERRFSHRPHLLVMTATPIPRSLALTLYGDLDLSVLDERPPGRKPVTTKILSGPPMANLLRLAERISASNQKAFVVFPLVEESEHMDLSDAESAFNLLKEHFGEDNCALLHGRMKADEKSAAMMRFISGKARFLVSTTVIEVGVDVPDASCMVIIHPERFGLAQLHQLRGRVGRGEIDSFCFLLSDIKSRFSPAFKRLQSLVDSDDGFKLSQIDLEIRGAGELLGTKQAGLQDFLVFNFSDFATIVEPAKLYAKSLMNSEKAINLRHLFSQESASFS